MTLASPERTPAFAGARRSFRFDLPNGATAPIIARAVVTDLMSLCGCAELVGDSRVLVSELVTNVYRHTRTAVVRLDVAVNPDYVRVAVWDDAPRSRLLSLPVPAYGDSGRGLVLVESLASRWGIYRPNTESRSRKGVWFVLDREGRDGGVP
ncbi:ATP-binding protein [Streptomyces sp. NPDC017529]|uniref:ATP-binding protein n=1 Tax=Streptomyces sp. NPDC017529 TaxID=3365000 RepID=UPI00379D4C43